MAKNSKQTSKAVASKARFFVMENSVRHQSLLLEVHYHKQDQENVSKTGSSGGQSEIG